MQWKTLNGLTSVNNELKEIAQLCGPEYDAWVVGGILEDRDTQDLDIIITGPNNPERINYLLEEIVYLGFKNQVWIDVKYSVTGRMFVASQYNTDMGKQSFLWASYQPEITINNRTFRYGIEKDGLWQSMQRLPLTKGYSFCDPVKLF
ncbi:MAG: hypothetical protein GY694_20870 [Gammaproteobacteria bacterium]|nr:hypothetical protein [Gammaproteobacteria bacterium]